LFKILDHHFSTNSQLFDVIKAQNPQWLDKIHIIQGNVSELRLGISPDDIKLMANVSVIFHVAASVRFDDPLKQSILMNTRGTHEIIKLALDMKQLVSFVHTSTTYFSHRLLELEETTYKWDYDWRTAIKAAEMFDEDTLNALTALYTNNSPNTYTFAKGLAEQVCMDFADQLPMTIYRPSVITSSEQEPIPAWTDSFNGPVGLFLACGYGVCRTMLCKPECELNCCPVDLCVKGMIISAWKKPIVDVPSSEIAVYNCASIRVITYSLAISQAKEHSPAIPFHEIMWAPGGDLTTSRVVNYLRTIFFQVVPAILVDCILRLKGRKPT
jgi:alcohol-forming fatty acyl-CoA reductase